MVVKPPSEEDNVSDNAHEISGDPTGNRTQMTGLEDRIRRCRLHSLPISRCRSSGLLAPHMSVLCRQVARLVVGIGGKTGGIPICDECLAFSGR